MLFRQENLRDGLVERPANGNGDEHSADIAEPDFFVVSANQNQSQRGEKIKSLAEGIAGDGVQLELKFEFESHTGLSEK